VSPSTPVLEPGEWTHPDKLCMIRMEAEQPEPFASVNCEVRHHVLVTNMAVSGTRWVALTQTIEASSPLVFQDGEQLYESEALPLPPEFGKKRQPKSHYTPVRRTDRPVTATPTILTTKSKVGLEEDALTMDGPTCCVSCDTP